MNLVPGSKLNGRYQIISQLGQGGFGATFLARDLHLPGDQQCAIKQLKPKVNDEFTWQTARRLFDTEARTLLQLGTHPQIPRLFAYFEENREFYLVEEYIEGEPLALELKSPIQSDREEKVISLLEEILEILEFVHQNNVIHRDINPHNLIRRKQDGKLVLIDFGAVKQISTQISQKDPESHTIAIGTPGYHPSEQANGNPKPSSDIYAVGAIGIQVLTGHSPHQLTTSETGEIAWSPEVPVSPELTRILDKMVRYDYRERYQSAREALLALKDSSRPTVATVVLPKQRENILQTRVKSSRSQLLKIMAIFGAIGSIAIGTIAFDRWNNSARVKDLLARGNTLYQLKRYEEALANYDRAIQIEPDREDAWKGRGDVLQNLKRSEEAAKAYEEAISLAPDNWQAWNGLARVLSSTGKDARAAEVLIQAIESIEPDDWETWNELGKVQMKLKQYGEAISSFDRVLELRPEEVSALYRQGLAYHQLQDYDRAIQSYDRVLKLYPYDDRAWYQRGNAAMSLKRYREAVDGYEKAVQYQPSFARAWFSKGTALTYLREYTAAIAAYDRAIEIEPKDYLARYQRGWALHQLGRYLEAIAAYDRAIQLNANYYQAWYNRANCLFVMKQFQEAIASFDRALNYKKDYSQAWYGKGNALLNLEQFQEAIAAFDRALQYQPNYREAIEAKERARDLSNSVIVEPEGEENE